MDRIKEYQTYIEEVIRRYGKYKPSYGEVEVQMVFDRENHHYQLINVGWHNNDRVRGCVLHIDLKGEKIWIQHDGTEVGIANDFIEMGVPKENIVLAFHAPFKRKYTDYATE